MNGHPIGYDERTMAILRGLLMARNDWRECLDVVAHALVGCGLGDQQITPAHVIHTQAVPVTIVGDRKELPRRTWYADVEPRLSCGHPRTSLRWHKSGSSLAGEWCMECEAKRARANAGNGG